MKRACNDETTNDTTPLSLEYGKRCYTMIDELKYWMIFDMVPCGLQQKEAGRDQTPILQLACIIGKIDGAVELGRKSIFIKPESFLRQNIGLTTSPLKEDNHPTDVTIINDPVQNTMFPLATSVLERCGLTQKYSDNKDLVEMIKGLATFEKVLEEMVEFVEEAMTKEGQETLPLLITETHTGIRNVFHREIMYRHINGQLKLSLAKYPLWFQYLDIGTIAFRTIRPASNNEVPQDLASAASIMKVNLDDAEGSSKTEFSRIDDIFKVLKVCLLKKVSLSCPHIIDEKYVPKVLSSSTYINSDCVIEIRQVPWTATPIILANFFAGLNICPGGVAILLSEGRRSNTAYILFTDSIMAKLALARHQHQLPSSVLMNNKLEIGTNSKSKCNEAIDELMHAQVQRITTLQVFPGSSKDFLNCSLCDIVEVTEFLNQLNDGEQVVVRIRGLPYSTTKDRVVTFFREVNAELLNQSEKSIFLVTYPDKRPTGDAFILFNNEQMANRALTRHKNYVGERYVELFKASPSEMIQVCNNVSKSQTLSGKPANFGLNVGQLQQFHQSNQLKCNLLMQSNLESKYFSPILSTPTTGQTVSPSFFPNQISFPEVNFNNSSSLFSMNANLNTRTSYSDKSSIQDLTDPTDPNCPFARALPQSGTLAMIQISNLPYDTSRHIVRLYLGPANFAKIYRMKRTDDDLSTGSKWLLSLENTTEGIRLIKDLIDKMFPGSSLVSPVFGLFGVAYDGKLYPINLAEYQMEIPLNRIAIICGGFGIPLQCDNQFQQLLTSQLLNASAVAATTQNPNQIQFPKSTFDLPVLDQSSGSYLGKSLNTIPSIVNCSVYVSGLPNNVTTLELMNIFQDILALLITQPKFVQVQCQNDQSTYCVTFSSPLEAQLSLSVNGSPSTILRNGRYTATLTPCLPAATSSLTPTSLGYEQLALLPNLSVNLNGPGGQPFQYSQLQPHQQPGNNGTSPSILPSI